MNLRERGVRIVQKVKSLFPPATEPYTLTPEEQKQADRTVFLLNLLTVGEYNQDKGVLDSPDLKTSGDKSNKNLPHYRI